MNDSLANLPDNLIERLRTIDLGAEIERWAVLGSGQNSVALLINDEWVFRFPLHDEASRSLQIEVEILQAIHLRLSVSTPLPEILLEDDVFEYPVVGYRLVEGEVLNPSQAMLFDTVILTRLGRNLGRFMNTLHASTSSQFSRSVTQDRDSIEKWEQLAQDAELMLKPRVEHRVWNRINRKIGKSVGKIARLSYEPVLRHGDFGFGNFLFNRQQRLTSVIDFGSAGFGDPAVDLAAATALNGPGERLLEPIRATYEFDDDMLQRARVYRDTFPLQHALLAARTDNEIEIERGITDYVGD